MLGVSNRLVGGLSYHCLGSLGGVGGVFLVTILSASFLGLTSSTVWHSSPLQSCPVLTEGEQQPIPNYQNRSIEKVAALN